MANDDDLLSELKRGDERAYREFWDRFYSLIHRHVLLREARDQSIRDTEDITQDTFARAYRSVEDFNGCSSLKTWLITLARHAAIDFYRCTHYRTVHVVDNQYLEAFEERFRSKVCSNMPAEPLQKVLDRERCDLCRALLAKLNEEQRAVIMYRQIDGLSTAETAALMGKSTGAVKMLLLRAFENLNRMVIEPPGHRKEVAPHG